jgi:hypothetical protein
MEQTYDYDVAVTFAGEDRQFVLDVVRHVTDAGYKIFYDQDEQVTLWGEELTEYFPKIYEDRSKYAVMFVSRYNAAKPWTRLERRSVLVRALNQATPYLLPVRLDATELPGLRTTISYLDGVAMGPHRIAMAICEKLGRPATGGGQFNGYVPRSEHEATVLVGERPPAWEYHLFSYTLVRGIENAQEKYLDFSIGYAEPSEYVSVDLVIKMIQQQMARIHSTLENFNTVLSQPAQQGAFGAPGEPGNVEQIIHLASRYVAVYEAFIDWAIRLRSYATSSDEARSLFRALSNYAVQPVERLRSFAYEFRAIVDTLHARLVAGENVTVSLEVTLEIPDAASADYEQELDRFERSLSS